MKSPAIGLVLISTLSLGCAPSFNAAPGPKVPVAELAEEVERTERAFAQTMADRDLSAFASFLADESIFFAGKTPLRGSSAVVERWSRYFEGEDAPFSWEPDQVEVLASGTLALSSGPVRNTAGEVIGRFNSVWRRQPSGWRIIFDKGSPVCKPCEGEASP